MAALNNDGTNLLLLSRLSAMQSSSWYEHPAAHKLFIASPFLRLSSIAFSLVGRRAEQLRAQTMLCANGAACVRSLGDVYSEDSCPDWTQVLQVSYSCARSHVA